MPSPRPRPRWVFPTLGTAPPQGAAPDVTVPSLCSAEGAPAPWPHHVASFLSGHWVAQHRAQATSEGHASPKTPRLCTK